MWGILPSSFCALALSAAVPIQSAPLVPSGEKQHFEYTVRAPIYLLKANIGSIVWQYESNDVRMNSYFKVKTTNQLVRDLLGADLTSIKSRTRHNQHDTSFSLESYLYEEFVDGEKLKFGLLFQNNKTICGKNQASQVVLVPCRSQPSGKVPDIFALLAWYAYVNNLESIVGIWQPAFYATKEEKIQLKKVENKVIKFNGSEVPVVMYNVENIAALLNKEDLEIIVGLREKFPHFMEYVEVKTRVGTLTLERKQ